MKLDPAVRLELANRIIEALRSAVEGSRAGLRGSLARGDADPYSDIDIFWELPDSEFAGAIDQLFEILSGLQPLESLRSDPLLQNSEKRRLLFAHFADVPLFWRVDIEVFAQSIDRDSSYDLDNAGARGDDWSLPHSALMNGVAALKELMRGNDAEACECLTRAFDRLGEPRPEGDLLSGLEALAEEVGYRDLDQAERVRSLQLLCAEARAARSCAPR